MLEKNQVYLGDCIELLPLIPDKSIDLVLTDPPYGIFFMGKDWDKALPDKRIWPECLRVLKPGAFAFVMSIPRADCLSRMIISLEDAGFMVNFTPIFWAYASGFPKAQNIGKAVDKRLGIKRKVIGSKVGLPGYCDKPSINKGGSVLSGRADGSLNQAEKECEITIPVTPQAKALDGSYGGFQPKPAVEVIIVAMKPLSEKTFVDQALKNRKGITWLDNGRIPTEETLSFGSRQLGDGNIYGKCEPSTEGIQNLSGRFPANLLVSDDVLNDGKVRKSGSGNKHSQKHPTHFTGLVDGYNGVSIGGDSGSFSRYFDLDAWWAKTFPFLIVPKVSKSEKNRGLENYHDYQYRECGFSANISDSKLARANHHPTVKPLKLMSYLITLGSREGDIVLDPFGGSGTTGLACINLKRDYILIEKVSEYCDIAKQRIEGQLPLCVST